MSKEKTLIMEDDGRINGGKRGYLVDIAPQEAVRILSPKLVKVGIAEGCPRFSGDTGLRP